MQPEGQTQYQPQSNQPPAGYSAMPNQPQAQPAPQGYPQQPPRQAAQPQPTQQPAIGSQPQLTKKNPNSTQNALSIAAIRDGVVIMNDGSFRAVVMAKSINFDLMSLQEQEAVEYAYQGFLNSLYFDIQIYIRSRKIDMRPYLEKLGRIRTETDNMLLGMLMEDYIYFIDDLVAQTNIMSKEFYVVVPYFQQVDTKQAIATGGKFFGGLFGGKGKVQSITIDEVSLEKAKTELKNRVQAVASGLVQMGVQAIPLDTQELIELYYNAYNPDTAERQPLKDTTGLEVPVVRKGEGQAPKSNLSGVL